MHRYCLRVLVGAEDGGVRDLFRDIVRREGQNTIVGEAESVATLVALARDSKPDVILLDGRIPHANRNDSSTPQSSGPDVAQTVNALLPGVLTVLVTNVVASGHNPDFRAQLFKEEANKAVPFALRDLYRAKMIPTPVMATMAFRPQPQIETERSTHFTVPLCSQAIGMGTGGIMIAVATFFTVVFAPVGAVIALAGALAILYGLAGKATNNLIDKFRQSGS